MGSYLSFILFCVEMSILLVPVLFVVWMVGALVSPRLREVIRKKKLLHLVWLVASIGILLLAFREAGHIKAAVKAAKQARTRTLMAQVQTAILNYQTEYDSPPHGNDNVALIKTLEGGNPRNIPFLTLSPNETNARGEALDDWGTPLRIIMADPQHPGIQSAGPDQTWVTKDDMGNATRF